MQPLSKEAAEFVASPVGQGLLTDESLWFRLVRRDGTYEYVSPNVQRYLGYRPEEFVALDPTDFIHPDEIGVSKEVMAALEAGPLRAIYRMKHKDGHYLWVSSHVQMERDLMVIIGRPVPPRLRGIDWQHVDAFL